MREPRYSILSDINDGIDRAKQGKLVLLLLGRTRFDGAAY